MKKVFPKQLINTRIQALIVLLLIFPASLIIGQIATTTTASRCGEGVVVLKATKTTGTIKWYSVPFYGTAVGTGETFTTPMLTVSTTYYVDALDANNCSLNPGNARVPVAANINENAIQASIYYPNSTYCKTETSWQSLTLTGTQGGVLKVNPSGGLLDFNSSTGAVRPSSSTNGTYTITYTAPPTEGCTELPATTTITITSASAAPSISYSNSNLCTNSSAPTLTLTGTAGGTYSATPAGFYQFCYRGYYHFI